MTFKEDLPYYDPGFWSITFYDAVKNYTVPNPINRYMLYYTECTSKLRFWQRERRYFEMYSV